MARFHCVLRAMWVLSDLNLLIATAHVKSNPVGLQLISHKTSLMTFSVRNYMNFSSSTRSRTTIMNPLTEDLQSGMEEAINYSLPVGA